MYGLNLRMHRNTAYYTPKTNKTYEELMTSLLDTNSRRAYYQNLQQLYGGMITRLTKLKEVKDNKSTQALANDMEERKKLSALARQLSRDTPQYATNVDTALAQGLSKTLDEILQDRVMVRQYNATIDLYQKAQRDMTFHEFSQKLDRLPTRLTKLDTPVLNDYRRELLEYMLSVFRGGKEYESYSPFNVILQGRPGVGKSHAAGLVAQALRDSCLLPLGDLVNLKKPDMIGQYLGQTAPKVYNKMLASLGGVVFIDEAYSIAGKKTDKGFDPYGVECLDALTDFASEHKGLIGIIVAGYKSEMKTQFLDVNVGLPRRFPVTLNLVRYPIPILLDMYLSHVRDRFSQVFKPPQGHAYALLRRVLYFLDTQATQHIEAVQSDYTSSFPPNTFGDAGGFLNVRPIFLEKRYYRELEHHTSTQGREVDVPFFAQQYRYFTEVSQITLAQVLYLRVFQAVSLIVATGVTDGDFLAYQSDDMSLLADITGRVMSATQAPKVTDAIVFDVVESFIRTRYNSVKVKFITSKNAVYAVFESPVTATGESVTEFIINVLREAAAEVDDSDRKLQQYSKPEMMAMLEHLQNPGFTPAVLPPQELIDDVPEEEIDDRTQGFILGDFTTPEMGMHHAPYEYRRVPNERYGYG